MSLNGSTSGKTMRVTLTGADELAAALEELPKALAKNVLQGVGKKALQPVLDDAKSRLISVSRVHSGHLLNAMQIGTRLTPTQHSSGASRDGVTIYVGPAAPKGNAGILLEFGTTERVQKTTGRAVGRIRPKPFMRPAWDSNKDRVLEIWSKEIWAILKKTAARLAKKAGAGTLGRSARRSLGGW